MRTGISVGQRKLLAKSCSRCHIFKQVCEYRVDPRGYYQAQCKSCQHKTAKIADHDRQIESMAEAKKSADLWTETEIKRLQELLDEKHQIKEIARIMGRSIAAIYNARHRYLPKETRMYTRDPNHMQVHKVDVRDMNQYISAKRSDVKAACGKVWSPTIPTDMTKEKCPLCFPKFAAAS